MQMFSVLGGTIVLVEAFWDVRRAGCSSFIRYVSLLDGGEGISRRRQVPGWKQPCGMSFAATPSQMQPGTAVSPDLQHRLYLV